MKRSLACRAALAALMALVPGLPTTGSWPGSLSVAAQAQAVLKGKQQIQDAAPTSGAGPSPGAEPAQGAGPIAAPPPRAAEKGAPQPSADAGKASGDSKGTDKAKPKSTKD